MDSQTVIAHETNKTANSILNYISGNDQKGLFFLDSSLSFSDRGRFSFFGINPIAHIVIEADILLNDNSGMTNYKKAYQNLITEIELQVKKLNRFAVGYFTYEATLPLLGLSKDEIVKNLRNEKNQAPLVQFFIYDSFLRIDSVDDRCEIIGTKSINYDDILTGQQVDWLVDTNIDATENHSFDLTKDQYITNVQEIKNYIAEGDIYQANFTCREVIKSFATPIEIYQRLRKLSPAPYSAYMNFGDLQVLSSSPERMFKIDGPIIKTSPIKGTIERGVGETQEKQKMHELLNSEKDKAELLMIVDLERNDLGKISKTGTVKVDNIYKPELYNALIHLVSDISAELKPDSSYQEILSAMLPGGSITGAPKKRATEIIQELENSPRGLYTGSIGYFYKDQADFNVAIRTIAHKNGEYHIHAGGGIVSGSEPHSEYKEMKLKAKKMTEAVRGGASLFQLREME